MTSSEPPPKARAGGKRTAQAAKTQQRRKEMNHEHQQPPHPEKIYIAGPMTGLPLNNFPAFYLAEQRLRRAYAGAMIENPARNPKAPAWMADSQAWVYYMRIALRQLVQCDAVLFLQGWEKSEGAKLEQQVAEKLGLQFVCIDKPDTGYN